MKKSEIQQGATREKAGRPWGWKYVIFQGLFWAVFVFFFTGLFHLNQQSFSEIYFSRSGLIGLLVYIVAGICLYRSLWWFQERNYKKRGKTYQQNGKPKY